MALLKLLKRLCSTRENKSSFKNHPATSVNEHMQGRKGDSREENILHFLVTPFCHMVTFMVFPDGLWETVETVWEGPTFRPDPHPFSPHAPPPPPHHPLSLSNTHTHLIHFKMAVWAGLQLRPLQGSGGKEKQQLNKELMPDRVWQCQSHHRNTMSATAADTRPPALGYAR